ncbi:MAG: GNAT family N-acetyltransferase [Steroidobacteraceae bacterium]
MKARLFLPDDAARWDEFCARAYGATFLHSRRFLSYHQDRFDDRSIVIEDAGGWLGVIPAARHPVEHDVVVSHPGITYGGVLHHGRLRGGEMLAALGSAAALWHAAGFGRLQYKAVPYIYQRAPAQEDLYALFRAGARRYRCDLSSCIDLHHRLPPSERRGRARAKALRAGAQIAAGNQHVHALWEVLQENLRRRHRVQPVHSLSEITTLAARFPDRLRVIVGLVDGKVEAGTLLFLTDRVAHAQYIASSERGHEVNALDLVLESALDESRLDGKRYFDFGISTENQGQTLNEGLNRFKNEFGAGGVAYEFYECDLGRNGDAIE